MKTGAAPAAGDARTMTSAYGPGRSIEITRAFRIWGPDRYHPDDVRKMSKS